MSAPFNPGGVSSSPPSSHPPPPPRPLRRRRRPRALSLSRDPGGKQWGGAAVLPPTATTGALWELARAKEGDAPRHGVALGGVVGFAKKGSCGTLVALAPVTSFLPRGSAPAYSRGKFVGSCWWGVKRLSLSSLSFPLSPGGESRGPPPPPPPLPRRRGGAGAGGAVVPPASGEGQIGHRRLAAAATARLAGGPLSWRRRVAWSSWLLLDRSPLGPAATIFLFPLLP